MHSRYTKCNRLTPGAEKITYCRMHDDAKFSGKRVQILELGRGVTSKATASLVRNGASHVVIIINILVNILEGS